MPRYAALLGSINVGGNRLKMVELRQALTESGFQNVETVMASGNVLFDSDGSTDIMADQVSACLKQSFNIDSFAIVRLKQELQAAIDDNPFNGVGEDKFVHSMCFVEPVSNEAFERLDADHNGPEKLAKGDREIYIDYVEGQADTKLTKAFIERRLGCSGTARSMNSLAKIIAKF